MNCTVRQQLLKFCLGGAENEITIDQVQLSLAHTKSERVEVTYHAHDISNYDAEHSSQRGWLMGSHVKYRISLFQGAEGEDI